MKLRISIIYLTTLILLIGCAKEESDKYSQSHKLMGTYVQVDTCLAQAETVDIEHVYDRIWERLKEISWRMNVYDEKSDVSKINQAYARPAHVEKDTYELIKKSLQLNHLTEGAFDITIWPLLQLWRHSYSENRIPALQEVNLAKQAVGQGTINLLTNQSIQLTHPLTKIDLGGIAKGYALDEAARIFREAGISNFYLDAGGDIYVGGKNCQGENWHIGIRDPRDKAKIIEIVEVSDAAVTTSGNYQQFLTISQQEFSHIINPITGFPQKGVISATVIAPSATEADALSTALTVLGQNKGSLLIERLGDGFASFVIEEKDNRALKYSSEKFDKYRL